jgi:coenzyme PQQ precursor peptide PqqA
VIRGRGTRLAKQYPCPRRTRARRPPTGGVTTHQEIPMQWTQPAFEDLRFGFEITMYIASR